MSEPVIQRVDLQALGHADDALDNGSTTQTVDGAFSSRMVRWFTIPLTVILCIGMAMVTLVASNVDNFIITATLVAVLVMGVIFTMALVINPILRLIYLGKWINTAQLETLHKVQSWVGKFVLSLGLCAAVRFGPSFMIWAYILILGLIILCMFGGIGLGSKLSQYQKELSQFKQGALAWVVCLIVALGAIFGLAIVGYIAVLILLVVAVAVYSILWVLSTRSFTRAELMTILAAMVVSSGISTFGLTEQLIPLIATPYNAEWNTPQARWDKELHPYLQTKLYITDAQAIRVYREGLRTTQDGQAIATPSEVRTDIYVWKDWTLFYLEVAKNLPWKIWVSPLSYWLIFVFGCYAMFYSLTYTIVNYWVDREKLIFPLAQLRESILPDADTGKIIPAICRSPGFWSALLLTAAIFSYNACVRFGWLGDMGVFPQGMTGSVFTATVKGTIFEGLGGGLESSMRFAIAFTAIGIAFLLPLEISFAIWFYYLLSRLLMLVLVWSGYGNNQNDFPSDWLYHQNAVTAQGAGALIVFSIIMLYRAVKDSGIHMFSKATSKCSKLWTALPIVALSASITVVTLWVWWLWHWNWSYLFWAFVFVIFLVLLTLGLMRITAEGGIYWFQAHGSFFHFWKMLAIGKFLPGTLLGPLLPVYSVLFLDLKTFMAPNIVDTAKMHKDTGGSRIIYHINMIVSVIISVIVSLGFAIVMAYARGAQRMQSWFYSVGPKGTMDTAQRAAASIPSFNTWTAGWAAFGGLWVIFSVIIRRTVFWFPHPIGYIMLVNPMIHTLWFSFFIGWICKKLVVKYGGKSTFDKTRYVFIGLILGEVLAICAWGLATLYTGQTNPFMTLNNYF